MLVHSSKFKKMITNASHKGFFNSTKRLLKDVTVYVNNKPITVDSSYTIFQACHEAGEVIPRFCFHEKLSVSGNCRMCLVEVEKSGKPVRWYFILSVDSIMCYACCTRNESSY